MVHVMTLHWWLHITVVWHTCDRFICTPKTIIVFVFLTIILCFFPGDFKRVQMEALNLWSGWKLLHAPLNASSISLTRAEDSVQQPSWSDGIKTDWAVAPVHLLGLSQSRFSNFELLIIVDSLNALLHIRCLNWFVLNSSSIPSFCLITNSPQYVCALMCALTARGGFVIMKIKLVGGFVAVPWRLPELP